MKGVSLTAAIFAGSPRTLFAMLALVLTAAGAVASATACCCPPDMPGPAHESTACPDGDEHGATPARHEGHDPCRDLVCPQQAATIETATIGDSESAPGHLSGLVHLSAAPYDSRIETEGALAIFATEHGPPVRTALHSVLRL